MKVLHVITGLDAGGAETQLAMLLRHTRNQSDVVTLYNPGPIADRIRDQGTSVRDLGMDERHNHEQCHQPREDRPDRHPERPACPRAFGRLRSGIPLFWPRR